MGIVNDMARVMAASELIPNAPILCNGRFFNGRELFWLDKQVPATKEKHVALMNITPHVQVKARM